MRFFAFLKRHWPILLIVPELILASGLAGYLVCGLMLGPR